MVSLPLMFRSTGPPESPWHCVVGSVAATKSCPLICDSLTVASFFLPAVLESPSFVVP